MPEPTRRDAIRAIVIEHVEAENAEDMDRVMRTYAEGAVFEDVPQGRLLEGKEAIAASYQERFDGFPGMVRTIDRLTVDEEGAIAEITMRGEQKGWYAGLPPRLGEQALRIAAHFSVSPEGLITRETAYYDAMTVAVDLGLLPDLRTTPGRLWLALSRPQVALRVIQGRLARRIHSQWRGAAKANF
jgi:steroid delta-isomerase-like uncharacterized protein